MFRNQYYFDSIALIFDGNCIKGWVPTLNEADVICKLYNSYTWDEFNHHKDYVDIFQLEKLSYLLSTETPFNNQPEENSNDKCNDAS